MARIRTIKPEFWTSEQVMDCGVATRLLFIGLWNFVDDYGRAPVAPRTIKAQIMPGDNFTGDEIQEMLNELCSRGLILFYSAEGKEYFEITGWAKHQKIDNPSKYKVCPAPFAQPSPVVAIPSEESQTIGLEGKGEEGKGKKDTPPVAKATRPRTMVADLFEEFWTERPRRKGDDPRKPAEEQFIRLCKAGEDPLAIIAGLKLARIAYAAEGKIGTEYIPQMVKWLRDRRYRDFADAAKPLEQIAQAGFYAKFGSEEQDAWDAYGKRTKGKTFPRDRDGGWRFPTQWPPEHVPRETNHDPPKISLQTMS